MGKGARKRAERAEKEANSKYNSKHNIERWKTALAEKEDIIDNFIYWEHNEQIRFTLMYADAYGFLEEHEKQESRTDFENNMFIREMQRKMFAELKDKPEDYEFYTESIKRYFEIYIKLTEEDKDILFDEERKEIEAMFFWKALRGDIELTYEKKEEVENILNSNNLYGMYFMRDPAIPTRIIEAIEDCELIIDTEDVEKLTISKKDIKEFNEMYNKWSKQKTVGGTGLKLNKLDIGVISSPDGKVDVTDPCYSRDTWCRMNDIEVLKGNYKCIAYQGEVGGEAGMMFGGIRVWLLAIVHENFDYDILDDRTHFYNIGDIAVDAGMAGFFINHDKPKDWSNWVETKKAVDENDNVYLTDTGFWSHSGIGDGSYPVKAIRVFGDEHKDGTIVGLVINFLDCQMLTGKSPVAL
ncbi:MAG: DUF4241 domain-containing protein [Oscillospiraceae bacterium]|jgi:hypothetical protein|nr:DUF4241 domain-containing protein [Oscillospiraceae bacterium]